MLYTVFLVLACISLTETIRSRFRRQLDLSYANPAYKHCECGRRNVVQPEAIRVVGGMEVSNNEYPWMTLLIGNGSQLICGGSLINDRYVLTAAHCLLLGFRQNDMKIVLGEHDRCNSDSRIVIFSIEKLVPHPSFHEGTYYADIMLVKLNMRVTFNEFIRPICLPKTRGRLRIAALFGGRSVSALGWGRSDTSEMVCALRIVDLELYKPAKCPSKVSSLICAGIETGGRDTCQGDSGGPLQMKNDNERFELIGIVSNGIGCGERGFPGLYTDVGRMIPWIINVTTQDSMYCWR